MACDSCGLVYSRAAIVREMALATGVDCRRCGGTLKADEAHGHRSMREPVQAVRAGAYGLKRRSSGWLSVDDDGGTQPSAPGHTRPDTGRPPY